MIWVIVYVIEDTYRTVREKLRIKEDNLRILQFCNNDVFIRFAGMTHVMKFE